MTMHTERRNRANKRMSLNTFGRANSVSRPRGRIVIGGESTANGSESGIGKGILTIATERIGTDKWGGGATTSPNTH